MSARLTLRVRVRAAPHADSAGHETGGPSTRPGRFLRSVLWGLSSRCARHPHPVFNPVHDHFLQSHGSTNGRRPGVISEMTRLGLES